MKKTPILASLTALVLLSVNVTAQGASLHLVPASPVDGLAIGDIFTFDIVMDFTGEPTIGGGFDIVYDTDAFQFHSLFRDPTIGEADFSRDPTIGVGLLDDWVVAAFTPLPEIAVLGSVSFVLIDFILPATVALTDARDGGAVPSLGGFWVSGIDFVSEIPVDYGSYTFVPLPAGLWLLPAALAALATLRRRS